MKRMRSALFFVIPAAAIVVGYLTLRKTEAESVPVVASKQVRTETLSPAPFRPSRDVSGFVTGARQADVAPKVGGYVVKLLKEEGDTVRAGETLAILDGSDQRAMLESAGISLDAAKNALSASDDFYDQKVDEAEASLHKAEDAYESGDLSSRDLSIAKEAVTSAKRMRDAQHAAAKAEVGAAYGGSLVAGAAVADATITAPFSGVVTNRFVQLGAFVGPGMPLFTVASTESLETRLSVPGDVATAIAKGDTVSVRSETGSDPVSGSVVSIARAVGISSQSTIVRVGIPADAGGSLLPGRFVTVTLSSGAARETVSVPETAIIHLYDDTFVAAVENDTVSFRKVVLGESVADRREIRSGIDAGTEVVVEGAYALRDGDRVTVSR
ncbi:MAG: efflux RND transporter periplasmic adaptor subunit [Candidatus Moranbacteria bacterium]|nr:efflux RND transporter periplasmic adaptor subunit [Candidatus Moranbacteria bacterium]